MKAKTGWIQTVGTGLVAGFALLCATLATAQEVRDPTRPPPAAIPQEPGTATPAQPTPNQPEHSALVMRDGKPYLVCGTRLCGVGQKIGDDTIERITESEVWLRNGKQVQKLYRFEGVQRRTVQP